MSFATPTGSMIEVKASAIASGQLVENVFHYVVTAQAGAGNSNNLGAEFQQHWEDDVMPLLNEVYVLQQIELRRVSGAEDLGDGIGRYLYDTVQLVPPTPPGIGGEVGPALPTSVTANARKLGNGPSTTVYLFGVPVSPVGLEKFFRGRTGVGPLTENRTSIDGNTLDPAYPPLLSNAMFSLLTLVNIAGADSLTAILVVPSLIKAGFVRTTAIGTKVIAYQTMNGFQVRSLVGSQLSRKARPAS